MGRVRILKWQADDIAFDDAAAWLRASSQPYRFEAVDDHGPLIVMVPPHTYHGLRAMAPAMSNSDDQTEYALGQLEELASTQQPAMVDSERLVDLSAVT